MATATRSKQTPKGRIGVIRGYDTPADSKNRITLRGAKTKYFHVKALANGSFLVEPRVLVSPSDIPARTLKMLDRSVAALKKGKASEPIDLSLFTES